MININLPKESGADKASELISSISGAVNGTVPGGKLGAPTGIPSFDKGGKVMKSGLAMVHQGDTIANKEGKVADKPHNVSLYRAIHSMHHGALHRALGVPEGEKIPAEKMAAAKKSQNPHVRAMAHFGSVLEGFHHGSR